MACPVAHILLDEFLPYIVVIIVTPFLLMGYCCFCLCRRKKTTFNRPVIPSPFQLPVVGCLPFINRDGLHFTFAKWAGQLGKVFSCRMGGQLCVVISDADLVREAMAKNSLSDRPDLHLFNLGRIPEEPESKGIIMNHGESWKQQRRFVLHTFKDFGIGKTSFEDVIADECERLADLIATQKQEPFDIRMLLNSAVANVVSTVLFGKDFEHSDKDFSRFVNHVANAAENLGGSAIMNFFPWARFLPYFRTIHNTLQRGMLFNFSVLRTIIEGEKRTFNENDIRNYTAAFLARQKSDDGRLFTDHHLVMSLSDIFSAGFETTATTLRWALLYVCLHPDIQEKIQDELDREVEHGKVARLAHREKLPWTEATLLEVQRIASIAPLGVPHAAGEDTEVGEFVIPRKAVIFTNLYYIHHDPENFPEPEKFKPERFLDEKRSRIVGTENLMPFATGKRSCPGESLAKMELFLFFSVLLQRFKFEFPEDYLPDTKPRCGLTNDTRPFLLVAVPRKTATH